MTMLETIRDLLTRLSAARSGEEIGRSLAAVASSFGLTEVLIVDLTKPFSAIAPALVFATGHRDDIEVADVRDPFMLHPSAAHARASEEPMVISPTRPAAAAPGEWTPRLSGHMSFAHGLIVPVHQDGQARWYVAFAGATPDLSERTVAVLSAAVHAAYERFAERSEDATRSSLTRREWECLQWIADGKTDFEVGRILDISPRTVRFHIDNAKVKLGVATRIQAVAKRLAGAV